MSSPSTSQPLRVPRSAITRRLGLPASATDDQVLAAMDERGLQTEDAVYERVYPTSVDASPKATAAEEAVWARLTGRSS